MGWGVVKSLELIGSGPVALVHTQKIEAQSEKPTWTKALEFTQFACPCGTDPRLLSGEQRTSHFKLVTSVDDPACVKTCASRECAELFSPFLLSTVTASVVLFLINQIETNFLRVSSTSEFSHSLV